MVMKNYILAIDEGTTSVRTIIFDKNLDIVNMAQYEIKQIFPKPSWVEQNPLDIQTALYNCLSECIIKSEINPNDIECVGITNQRETTIVWDKKTGKPVYNAIVWQCRRTSTFCESLIADGKSEFIREKTGLKIDAYFSASKIKWILDNVPYAREKANNGELLFGTVDTFILWKLSGGKLFITDRTNACRTMLMNIHTGEWDNELLEFFDIPKCMLPEIKSSSEIYGKIDLFGVNIPVAGIAGDQQSALFGQCCFDEGDAKNTYGTGCFMLTNTGHNIINSKYGLITTVLATAKNEPLEYALEGSVFVGGAIIQWLRDKMQFIKTSSESEEVALSVPDTLGVYIVPAFAGLGAPYWNMDARGTIVGLTQGTEKAHIVRACLESIAFQSNDVLKAMEKDLGKKITCLKVDGGASANNLLMQFQADVSNVEVCLPNIRESTALGVTFLAGLATGFFKNKEDIKSRIKINKFFKPKMNKTTRENLLENWEKAVNSCNEFSK